MVFLWVALGAGLFKPVVQATIGKTTNEETSSIGFGIFYMIINIGSLLGRGVSYIMRKQFDLSYIFAVSVFFSILAFFAVLIFYTDPDKESGQNEIVKKTN